MQKLEKEKVVKDDEVLKDAEIEALEEKKKQLQEVEVIEYSS